MLVQNHQNLIEDLRIQSENLSYFEYLSTQEHLALAYNYTECYSDAMSIYEELVGIMNRKLEMDDFDKKEIFENITEVYSFSRDQKLLSVIQGKLEEEKSLNLLCLFSYLASRQINLLEKDFRNSNSNSGASSDQSAIVTYLQTWLYESACTARKFIDQEIVDVWMLENVIKVFDEIMLSPDESHIWYKLILDLFNRFPVASGPSSDQSNSATSSSSTSTLNSSNSIYDPNLNPNSFLNKVKVSQKVHEILINNDIRHSQYIQHSELGIAAMKTVGNDRKSLFHQVQLLLYLAENMMGESGSGKDNHANDSILLKLKDLSASLGDCNHVIKSNLLNLLLKKTSHNEEIKNMVMLDILNDKETSGLNLEKIKDFFDPEGSEQEGNKSKKEFMLFGKYLKITAIDNNLNGQPIIDRYSSSNPTPLLDPEHSNTFGEESTNPNWSTEPASSGLIANDSADFCDINLDSDDEGNNLQPKEKLKQKFKDTLDEFPRPSLPKCKNFGKNFKESMNLTVFSRIPAKIEKVTLKVYFKKGDFHQEFSRANHVPNDFELQNSADTKRTNSKEKQPLTKVSSMNTSSATSIQPPSSYGQDRRFTDWINSTVISQFRDNPRSHGPGSQSKKIFSDKIEMETCKIIKSSKNNLESICIQPVNFNKICESNPGGSPDTTPSHLMSNYGKPALNASTSKIVKNLENRTPEIELQDLTLKEGENKFKIDLYKGALNFKAGLRYQLEVITLSVGPYIFIQDKLEPLFGFDYISRPHEISLDKNYTPTVGALPNLVSRDDHDHPKSATNQSASKNDTSTQSDTEKENPSTANDDTLNNEQDMDVDAYFPTSNMNRSLFTSFVHSIKLKVALGSLSNNNGIIIKLQFFPQELVPVFPQETITSSYITRKDEQIDFDVDFIIKNDDYDKSIVYLIEEPPVEPNHNHGIPHVGAGHLPDGTPVEKKGRLQSNDIFYLRLPICMHASIYNAHKQYTESQNISVKTENLSDDCSVTSSINLQIKDVTKNANGRDRAASCLTPIPGEKETHSVKSLTSGHSNHSGSTLNKDSGGNANCMHQEVQGLQGQEPPSNMILGTISISIHNRHEKPGKKYLAIPTVLSFNFIPPIEPKVEIKNMVSTFGQITSTFITVNWSNNSNEPLSFKNIVCMPLDGLSKSTIDISSTFKLENDEEYKTISRNSSYTAVYEIKENEPWVGDVTTLICSIQMCVGYEECGYTTMSFTLKARTNRPLYLVNLEIPKGFGWVYCMQLFVNIRTKNRKKNKSFKIFGLDFFLKKAC